jgi:tetratricopeptide (TPR) repeat protein
MTIESLRTRGRFVDLAAALEAELAPAGGAAPDGPFRDAGPDRVEVAARLHELGRVQWHLARFDEAQRNLSRALELREQLLGPVDARTIDSRERLAALYHYRVDTRAEPLFREVVAQREAVHGADSAEAAIAQRNLGALLRDLGHTVEALGLLEAAAKQLARRLGSEHPDHAAALKARAFLLVEQVDVDQRTAERASVDALVATCRAHDVDHPFAGAARLLLARAEVRARRYSGAAREVARALSALRSGYGDEHPLVAIALLDDGRICFRQDNMDAALDRTRRGAELLARWYPRGASAAYAAYDVAAAAAAAGDPDVARTWIGRATEAVHDDPDAHRTMVATMLDVSRWVANTGDIVTARRLLSEARDLTVRLPAWRSHIEAAAAHVTDMAKRYR